MPIPSSATALSQSSPMPSKGAVSVLVTSFKGAATTSVIWIDFILFREGKCWECRTKVGRDQNLGQSDKCRISRESRTLSGSDGPSRTVRPLSDSATSLSKLVARISIGVPKVYIWRSLQKVDCHLLLIRVGGAENARIGMNFLLRRSPINVLEGMARFVNKPKRTAGCSKNVHLSNRAKLGLFHNCWFFVESRSKFTARAISSVRSLPWQRRSIWPHDFPLAHKS